MGDRPLNSGSVSLRERFDEAFAYYIAIGMPYELYWDGRPELVIPYRRADIMRQKRTNSEAWMLGAYVQHAVASVLDKKAKYPKQPFEIEEPAKHGALTAKQEKAKAAFLAFAERFNNKMHSDADAKG